MLALILAAWLPLRAGLMMALYLQRVLRSDPDRPLHAMNHFFRPWMLLLLLAVPVLLAWRFVRLSVPLEDGTIDLPSPAGRGAEGEGGEEPSEALTLTLSQRERGPEALTLTLSRPTSGRCPERGPDTEPSPPSAFPLPPSLLIALAVALVTAATTGPRSAPGGMAG